MANISQVEVNGTTYDICDATARDSISQKTPSGMNNNMFVPFIYNNLTTVEITFNIEPGDTYTCPVTGWYGLFIDTQDGRVAQFNISGINNKEHLLLGTSNGSVLANFPFKQGTVIGTRGQMQNTQYLIHSYLRY